MFEGCKTSVVMPTYNGAAYLEETLRSLVGQSPGLYEVLLIDDGSTDRTLEIARAFQSSLPLRIIERPRIGNWVVNTNLGICESRGEFVTILHQDDLWLPGRLQSFADCLAKNSDCEIFLNSSRYIDQRGRGIGLWTAPLPPDRSMSGAAVREKLIVQNFISMPGPIFRRSLLSPEIESTGAPLDSTLWYTADWKLWLTLTDRGNWFYHADPLSCFRVHGASLTARAVVDEEYKNQFLQVIERFAPAGDTAVDAAERRALALFSVEVNLFLASVFTGSVRGLFPLARSAWRLGFGGLAAYCHTSRIRERLTARLRALVGFKLRSLLALPRCVREVAP